VLQLEGREILAVAKGEDVAPGIRLVEVHPDRILLERNGARETLAWPGNKAVAGSPAPRIDK
jgi:general secretion pathway protein C